ncbi:MAG TPA: PAS domain-containing protein, partial [Pseudomonadales bacterium]|nr:PAS domain-containing protein [Pseudomonadales bacterium]
RMTGYSLAELIGKSPKILQGKRSNQRILLRLKEEISSGKHFHGATINYRKNGDPYPVEWNISPIVDVEGRISHYISVQKDLSNLQKVMSRLKQTNQHFREFLREIAQPSGQGAAADSVGANERKQRITEELLENVSLYNPALRTEDSISLFGESEFFDVSEGLQGVLGEKLEREHISAQQYAQQQRLSAHDVAELMAVMHEILEQLDLYAISGNKTKLLDGVAKDLQDLANHIFYLDDFVSISSVLSELATRTRRCAGRDLPPFMIDTYRALVTDLETWVKSVFIEKTAHDIHEVDASIISSAKQLILFLH